MSISEKIIKLSFNFSVWLLSQFADMAVYQKKGSQLRNLPAGTLGNDIAQCLEKNKLQLVPNFESHDLKHVLLGYDMTPLDEIRMQAFMLGNGNYTIPCFSILLFGMILLPDHWLTLYRDFNLGRRSQRISHFTIEDYASQNTNQLRNYVLNSIHQNITYTMKNLTTFGAYTLILSGIFGMLFCLPFLFSTSIIDIVGAGFPFIGGAILTVGGFLILAKFVQSPNYQVS